MPTFSRPTGNGVGVFQSAAPCSAISTRRGNASPDGIFVSPAFLFKARGETVSTKRVYREYNPVSDYPGYYD